MGSTDLACGRIDSEAVVQFLSIRPILGCWNANNLTIWAKDYFGFVVTFEILILSLNVGISASRVT
ncbi:hypothetical protein ARNL5_00474 [Anaerolineae bacterium]|nr:hypothetical protein ARNL5_00474 [Anaerolineae bacterium]